jgi:hypothetical protein
MLKFLSHSIDPDGNILGAYFDLQVLTHSIDANGNLCCWQLHEDNGGRVSPTASATSLINPESSEAGSGARATVSTRASRTWKAATKAWIFVKKHEPAAVIESNDVTQDIESIDVSSMTLPCFDPEWKDEFEESQVNPLPIKLIAAFVGAPIFFVTIYYLSSFDIMMIAAGGWEWSALQYGGYCLVSATAIFILLVFSATIPLVKRIAVKHFETLSIMAVVFTLTGLMCVCVCVCAYLCMHVCMYFCMYVYVCMYVCMWARAYVCLCVVYLC